MDIYSRINEIRVKKGVTWKHLNENTPGKVYSSRMTELKNGKTTLSNDQLQAIANILETSIDYLLGNTDDPSPPGAEERPLVNDDVELTEYLEQLRNRPEMRMLFSVSKGATKADIEKAVAIIEALRNTERRD